MVAVHTLKRLAIQVEQARGGGEPRIPEEVKGYSLTLPAFGESYLVAEEKTSRISAVPFGKRKVLPKAQFPQKGNIFLEFFQGEMHKVLPQALLSMESASFTLVMNTPTE